MIHPRHIVTRSRRMLPLFMAFAMLAALLLQGAAALAAGNTPPTITTNTGLAVAEGASGMIAASNLTMTDAESGPAQITYTVTGAPANGTLQNGATALTTGGTFTQADLNANTISYTHNGSETTSDSLGFRADDGSPPPSTSRVSLDSSGTQSDSASQAPKVSADGRFVAFQSTATNLVAGDTNGTWDIFVRDTQTNTTTRVSVDSSGVQGNNASYTPALSADGRVVAFRSYATNLVTGDSNTTYDIFVRDTQTNTTTRVSVDSSGVQGNNASFTPAISADGRFVAFYSYATNLVAGDTNNQADVFVRDTQTNTTTRVSVDSSGVQGNSFSADPAISADGRVVAFYSAATNLVTGDTNGQADVFARAWQDSSVSGTFAFTITPVNDAPVAADGSLTTVEDTVASGTFSATDVDGDALTYSIVTNGSNGTATITDASTGAFTYMPDADYNGSDSVTFNVNDGTVDSNVATVTITITSASDAPTAMFSSAGTVDEGSTVSVHFSNATDTDPADVAAGFRYSYDFDNDGTFDLGDGTYAGGVLSDSASIPAALLADGPGTVTVRAWISDQTDNHTEYTATVTVINVAPTASAGGPYSGAPNSPIALHATASDPGQDTLSYAWDLNDDGVFDDATGTDASFTAATPGSYVMHVRVSDDDGAHSDAMATVTITAGDTVPAPVPATRLYLPLLERAPALPEQQDLVVESTSVQNGTLQVVVKNQGGRAVTAPFWVDAYINPDTAPTGVNQTWPMLGERGLAWGIRNSALPLAPGARLTLTVNDSAYVAAKSNPGGTIAAGSTVYVQVDSASVGSSYGAVDEADEQDGGTYNNIASIVLTNDLPLPAAAPATTQAAPIDRLPARPE